MSKKFPPPDKITRNVKKYIKNIERPEEYPLCPERIKDLVFNNKQSKKIKKRYRNIKNGIFNLIKYFNIIWKDRDWDFIYFIDLLSFKLNNIKKDQLICPIEGTDEIVKRLDRAIEICKILLDDNVSIYQNQHEILVEELTTIIKEDLFKWWT